MSPIGYASPDLPGDARVTATRRYHRIRYHARTDGLHVTDITGGAQQYAYRAYVRVVSRRQRTSSRYHADTAHTGPDSDRTFTDTPFGVTVRVRSSRGFVRCAAHRRSEASYARTVRAFTDSPLIRARSPRGRSITGSRSPIGVVRSVLRIGYQFGIRQIRARVFAE